MRLQASDAVIARFAQLLSMDERERARRFAFEHLRRFFTLARGALRILLGGALAEAPGAIRFAYGDKGKPRLAAGVPVRFNISHSGKLVLIAITSNRELGVDIEQIRPMPDLPQVAERFFSPEEAGALMSLPEEQRLAAFFRCWTRKEAYIKAIGDGLSAALDGFAVSLLATEPARIIHLGGNRAAAEEWNMHDLEVESGYAAALAYRGERRTVLLSPTLTPAALLDQAPLTS